MLPWVKPSEISCRTHQDIVLMNHINAFLSKEINIIWSYLTGVEYCKLSCLADDIPLSVKDLKSQGGICACQLLLYSFIHCGIESADVERLCLLCKTAFSVCRQSFWGNSREKKKKRIKMMPAWTLSNHLLSTCLDIFSQASVWSGVLFPCMWQCCKAINHSSIYVLLCAMLWSFKRIFRTMHLSLYRSKFNPGFNTTHVSKGLSSDWPGFRPSFQVKTAWWEPGIIELPLRRDYQWLEWHQRTNWQAGGPAWQSKDNCSATL